MDMQNVNLQTPLHLAVERQHTQIVRVSTYRLLIGYSDRFSMACCNDGLSVFKNFKDIEIETYPQR